MNREYLMIGCMGAGGILGAIGGTGFKPARRFILPFVLGILALLAGFVFWKCLAMAIGLIIAFCLPYGSKTPYWGKCLTAIAMVIPTLFLGFTWWQVITPVTFILMFWLSNTKWASNTFVWKIVEFITFGFVGATVASLIK